MAKQKKSKPVAGKKQRAVAARAVTPNSAENDTRIAALQLGFYAHCGFADIGRLYDSLAVLCRHIGQNSFAELSQAIGKVARKERRRRRAASKAKEEWAKKPWAEPSQDVSTASDRNIERAVAGMLNRTLRASFGDVDIGANTPTPTYIVHSSGSTLLEFSPKVSSPTVPLPTAFQKLQSFADAAGKDAKDYTAWYRIGACLGDLHRASSTGAHATSDQSRKKHLNELCKRLQSLVRDLPEDERKQVSPLKLITTAKLSKDAPETFLPGILAKLAADNGQDLPDDPWRPPTLQVVNTVAERLKTIKVQPPKPTVTSKPMSRLQRDIMQALDGKALTRKKLAEAIGLEDESRFSKPNSLKELMAVGLVTNGHDGRGYWRPNAPPVDMLPPQHSD